MVAALAQLRGPVAARTLSSYGSGRGLLREHPLLACALGLALLSLAGLPPGVLGVVAKVVALRPVVADGLWLLAVVAAANAVLGVAVYLRWLRLLLGPRPGRGRGRRAGQPRTTGAALRASAAGSTRPVLAAARLTFAALVLTSLAPELLVADQRRCRSCCSGRARRNTGASQRR